MLNSDENKGETLRGPSAGEVEPTDAVLHSLGWAPGDYMAKCFFCKEIHYDSDKRSVRCRPCAVKEFKARKAEPSATPRSEAKGPTPSPSLSEDDVHLAEFRRITKGRKVVIAEGGAREVAEGVRSEDPGPASDERAAFDRWIARTKCMASWTRREIAWEAWKGALASALPPWATGEFTPEFALYNILLAWTPDQCREFFAMLSRRPDFAPTGSQAQGAPCKHCDRPAKDHWSGQWLCPGAKGETAFSARAQAQGVAPAGRPMKLKAAIHDLAPGYGKQIQVWAPAMGISGRLVLSENFKELGEAVEEIAYRINAFEGRVAEGGRDEAPRDGKAGEAGEAPSRKWYCASCRDWRPAIEENGDLHCACGYIVASYKETPDAN